MYTFQEFVTDLQAAFAQVEAESEPLFDISEGENMEALDPDMLAVWEDR